MAKSELDAGVMDVVASPSLSFPSSSFSLSPPTLFACKIVDPTLLDILIVWIALRLDELLLLFLDSAPVDLDDDQYVDKGYLFL